jgi:hypothetical protein
MPSYSKTVEIPGKSAQELYDVVSRDIDRFMAKASLPGKVDITRKPESKQVAVKHSMLSATLFCEDGKLRLDAQLSLLATPFRSKIDDGIAWWVGKAFPGTKV